jgi:hypothetical protein
MRLLGVIIADKGTKYNTRCFVTYSNGCCYFIFARLYGQEHSALLYRPHIREHTAHSVVQGRAMRKPTLLFLLCGLFLLRLTARKLSVLLLFHEPPRNTRSPKSLHKQAFCLIHAFFIHPPNKRPISFINSAT